ncbi:VOC family protein [Flavobacterium sufflavum]|uniref:VOC family protein n=1 Tax=Flavobacterium sufflavum TaxID=1921138 RepID=A0A437KMK2_9FLAO|nr:VOC family protein [Flavobacterium sufflavum]RVT72253.1 VOC family protein [Flavobacterium sufflavum]
MKIIALELLTADIEGTTAFYHKKMGLAILSTNKSSVSFAAGSTKLTFRYSKNTRAVYHFAFDIPNNKLFEAFDYMEKEVAILDVIPPEKIADFYNWDAKSFYFYDNNGNVVEFIARYCLNNESDAAFDGASIVSVSEIGFVAKDVSVFSEELFAKYTLSVFSKQPKLEKFVVLGTDTGLFILSAENRNWYPTDTKCQSFGTKVVFENNGLIKELEVI